MPAKSYPQKLHTFPYKPGWRELRLKQAVQQALPDLGSRHALLLIKNGLVKIGDSVIQDADAAIPEGTELSVDLRHGVHGRGDAKQPHLHERMKVHYDDDHLVVVEKQAGTLVQPAEGSKDAKGAPLIELLKHYWRAKSQRIVNPVVIQRLDVGTSGLLVMGKTADAAKKLQRQLKPPRNLRREYLALVAGDMVVPRGSWLTYLGRGPMGLRQSRADERAPLENRRGLQEAETHFQVLKRWGAVTLLRLRLETGRTHQIRIHCAEAGHPILADDLYFPLGERTMERLAQQKFLPKTIHNPAHEALRQVQDGMMKPEAPKKAPPRLALHSTRLSFTHPATKERLQFEAPMPADLQRWIDRHLKAEAQIVEEG